MPGDFPPGQSTHQAELAAVVDTMRQDAAPEDLSNGHVADEERELPIEVFRLQLADARHRFPVHSLVTRRERLDGLRGRSILGGLASMVNRPVSMRA